MAQRSTRIDGIAPEWFALLRTRMAEKGLFRDADLAAHLRLDQVDVHRMFHGRAYSRTIGKVVAKMDMPPPLIAVRSPDDPIVLDLLQRLRAYNPGRYKLFIDRLHAVVAGEEAERDL